MLIKLDNIKKEFITGEIITKVLHGISFEIDKGDFVSIMGPSGSGKSTLMHIIGLLDKPSSGNYLLEDRDVTTLNDEELALMRNEKIGFVFQSFNLLAKSTVLENVMLPLVYSNKKGDAEEKARDVLDQVGLSHRVDYMPNQISGGEKQRVAIARALVNEPSVIFAEEPTGNLDSKSGIQIMEILQKLNEEGNTIILVTHETFTAEHAKRIIYIRDGLLESDNLLKKRRFAHDGDTLK